MGVDLSSLVRGEEISFELLFDKKIAIDAMNTLYQFLSIIRQPDGTPLKDSKGRVTSHLSGLFYRTVKLIEYNIRPVYVFDGEPPVLKTKTGLERKKRREEALREWKRLRDEGKVKEAYQKAIQSSSLTSEMVSDSKKLLEFMGIPYVQAPSEGEAQAAFMNKNGQVWATGSQDYDALLFDCTRLVKNLSITGKRKLPKKEAYIKISPELIKKENILNQLQITHEKLIWIAILIGTDFNEGCKGMGPKTALELVKNHNSFESLLNDPKVEWKSKNDPFKILRFFKEPPVKKVEFKFALPDSDRIKEFLCEEHDFSKERVENTLNKLLEAKKQAQTGLGKFFKV